MYYVVTSERKNSKFILSSYEIIDNKILGQVVFIQWTKWKRDETWKDETDNNIPTRFSMPYWSIVETYETNEQLLAQYPELMLL